MSSSYYMPLFQMKIKTQPSTTTHFLPLHPVAMLRTIKPAPTPGSPPLRVTLVYVLSFFKFILFYLFLFLAALGLRCCAQAFSSCGERGLPFAAVCRLLIAVVSLVAEHGL